MLPRNCFLLAASKSNSSTRLPRTTTTRVSSGWAASISILFAIDECLHGSGASGADKARIARSDVCCRIIGFKVDKAGTGVGRARADNTRGRRSGACLCVDCCTHRAILRGTPAREFSVVVALHEMRIAVGTCERPHPCAADWRRTVLKSPDANVIASAVAGHCLV